MNQINKVIYKMIAISLLIDKLMEANDGFV